MVIYSEPFDKKILLELQTHYFGDMVKGVVDISKRKIALDPEMEGDDFLEFDSLINIRPNQGNRSRGVENPATQEKIKNIIYSLCK